MSRKTIDLPIPKSSAERIAATDQYNQTNIRAVVKELVETTEPRPGRQYLLVDSDYVEQLADIVGATIGARSRRKR